MNGSCLCGAIEFSVSGDPKGFAVCHCGQCRKQSGHVWASAYVPDADLTIEGDVTWFQSSVDAKRGFCAQCGSFLFWKLSTDDHISFSLGSIDGPTGKQLEKQIFTADKGDYYDIADDLPKS